MVSTVESGDSVSHYRVIGPLGAGGMGEVYKAQDVTLERTVALKILPPELVRNDERVRRFMQEAKSASSLNHPNIVTIHEIGQDGSIHYIAMELIDGVTFKRKVHEEQTDLRTLLQYLAQAADGLAKAHAAGIVHRDLKPENIMVTRDGFAKVLDFGLAKLSIKKAPDTTNEATEVRNATREGAVMGTVAYMSPEQVQGRVVDHRSDIFSFGCILYEAATRRRPFDADSDVDLMHKILHDKPQPVDELNPEAPAELRRMIRRCLAKDPEKRYQSMKDLAIELNDIVEEYDELSASVTSASSGSGAIVPIAPQRPFGWIVAALLALAIVGAGIYAWRRARTTVAPPVAFQSMKIQRLTTTGQGTAFNATISPDGKYLAYVLHDAAGKFSLWVRQIATGSDVQAVAPVKTAFPGFAFSPDGNYLFYVNAEMESGAGYSWLYQVPSLGGTPRKLLFDVDTAPTFSPDGKQLAFGRGDLNKHLDYVVVANVDGSGPRILCSYKRAGAPLDPTWSPDGKRIATMRVDSTGGAHAVPIEFDVTTGKEQPIGSFRWRFLNNMRWLPDGSGLLVIGGDNDTRRSQVWVMAYPDGKPVRVTNDTNNYGALSLTADGKSFATMRFENTTELTVSELSDPSGGKPLPIPAEAQQVGWLSVARNGAVVYSFSTDKQQELAIVDAPGAQPRVLTSDGGFTPSISADGKTIVYTSRRIGDIAHIFAMDSEGSNVRQLTRGGGEALPSISADGQTILHGTVDSKLFKMNASGGGLTQITDRLNGGGIVSPDGSKIVYGYIEHGGQRDVPRLRIVPAAGGAPLLDIPWQAGGPFRWSPKNDGFTFIKPVEGTPNIFLQPLSGAPPVQLTHFKKGFIAGYDWTADGKLVMSHGDTRSEMILVSNFR